MNKRKLKPKKKLVALAMIITSPIWLNTAKAEELDSVGDLTERQKEVIHLIIEDRYPALDIKYHQQEQMKEEALYRNKLAQDQQVYEEQKAVEEAEAKRIAEEEAAKKAEDGIPAESTYIGTFTISAYCSCEYCCGKSPGEEGYGITTSGNYVKEGVTIAADTDVLPMGTEVYIEDVGYRTVEDTGGAIDGYNIDLYFDSHQDALNFGVQQLDVYIN